MQSPETEIPLYNCNNEFMLNITLAEARDLAGREDAELKSKGYGRKFRITAAQLMRRDDKKLHCSKASISRSEMERNAFGQHFRALGPTDSIRALETAIAKVANWPNAHDDRNFVISAGVPYGVFCIWPPQEERIINFA